MKLTTELLKQVLVEQRKNFLSREFGVERSLLNDLNKKLKLPHILVITGLRRCGKSTLLRQIVSRFYRDKNFFYINFEDERLLNFETTEFNRLLEASIELFGNSRFICIDEIQNVENFDSFVRRLYGQGYKLCITGSNAGLMSKEISTKLTGRHIDIALSPFHFTEFLRFKGIKLTPDSIYETTERAVIKKEFDEYLFKGGMPEYLIYGEDEILTRIYSDIVIKDIAVRHNITNINQLKEVYQYLISNYCQKFSFNFVKRGLNLGSVNTAIAYVEHLTDTFFGFIINKFDYSYKKQIINDKKFYLIDNGFISKLSTKYTRDTGWLLENLVCNCLNVKNKIYYFSDKGECDFVIVKDKEITDLIQVCSSLTLNNRKREIDGLLEAMDYFGLNVGFILTYDQEDEEVHHSKTINIVPVWKWLLA